VLRLRSYLQHGRLSLAYDVRSGGRSSEISFLQLMKLTLIEAGWNQAQIWDVPYSEAKSDYIALTEMHGGCVAISSSEPQETAEEACKRLYGDRQPMRVRKGANE
jgi:hypothetical protein